MGGICSVLLINTIRNDSINTIVSYLFSFQFTKYIGIHHKKILWYNIKKYYYQIFSIKFRIKKYRFNIIIINFYDFP